jgi:glycosyltransferase involved in cell wall biosynthesis
MTICLNMIVKNESKNLPACLESIKDVVDYYIINDNGSTDGTPEMIKEIMDGYGIKGEVYSSEWVNFGHNREEALQKVYQDGRWDYALILDADGTIHHTNGAFKGLTADLYMVNIHFGNIEYDLPFLLSTKKEFHWKGPVHNYIVGSGSHEVLKDAYVIYRSGAGAKSHGVTSEEKFLRDAELLEKELEKNPTDSRSMFYLAQSYRDAGKPAKAYKCYMKRVQMGGWVEEVFLSMYYGANCKWLVEKVFPLDDYLAAYNYRPSRAEPLFKIAEYYRKDKMYNLGYLFVKAASEIPYPADKLFIDRSIYDWRVKDELSICAYWIGKYQESKELCNFLLESGKLPEREIQRVTANRKFSRRKLGE